MKSDLMLKEEAKAKEHLPEGVVRYIEEEILYKVVPPDEVAGFVIEPIQGEGGYILPAPGFFPALRKLCDRYGILLIADEVQSGVGRTGKWWAIQNFGVEPDIICAAKGIASGMPLGAMVARKHLVTWPRGAHGNTYGGNPLSCAAAVATLDLVASEYAANAARVGEHFMQRLRELQRDFSCIGEVRGKGLMIGIELDRPCGDLVGQALAAGLLVNVTADVVIRLLPPLVLEDEQAQLLVDTLEALIRHFLHQA